MKLWYIGLLRDREPGEGGGGTDGVIAVNPGAPFEHGYEVDIDTPAPKTDIEKRLEALENDNKALRTKVTTAEDEAKFWSRRAANAPQPQTVVVEREAPAPAPRREEPTEKPTALLDDMTARGMQGLVDRGVITSSQMIEELDKRDKNIDARMDAKINATRAEVEFGGKMSAEFPEIVAISAKISAGQTEAGEKSELWQRTKAQYKEIIAQDPQLDGSQTALLQAARFAKKDLELEKKTAKPERRAAADIEDEPEPRVSRRERIERQAPERSSGGDGEERGGGDDGLTAQQSEVAKRLGVKADDFKRHRDAPRARR